MKLDIVAIQGYATWWIWVIRDTAGVVVEKSTMQFRSATTAESKGRDRIAQLDRS